MEISNPSRFSSDGCCSNSADNLEKASRGVGQSEKIQPDQQMSQHKKDEGAIRAIKDITAGSVGGIAQVLTGQPFDIVKVLLLPFSQTNTEARY